MVRQHQWVDTTDYSAAPYWENRRCSVCGLDDLRLHNRSEPHTRNNWEVTSPCIELVPDTVSYEDLVRELAEHDVRAKPWVVGVPGDWKVGFFVSTFPYPSLEAKAPQTLEHGFAKLLRWIRARQYNVNRYSQFYEMERRANYVCPCADDD